MSIISQNWKRKKCSMILEDKNVELDIHDTYLLPLPNNEK